MLKITPYMWIPAAVVSVAGFWYPKLGYFLVAVVLTLMTIAPFKGRWFCGNLCPKGSFIEVFMTKFSLKRKIPKFFKTLWIRLPILVLMMGMMIIRVIKAQGVVDKIGMVFVVMCLMTFVYSFLMGSIWSPRAWCNVCPMGTMQNFMGGKKYKLKTHMNKCIHCGICAKVCPMQLSEKKIIHNPDCIKCGKCLSACPKDALYFK